VHPVDVILLEGRQAAVLDYVSHDHRGLAPDLSGFIGGLDDLVHVVVVGFDRVPAKRLPFDPIF
jgi:hypothetical protein